MESNEAILITRAALLGDSRAFGKLVEHYQSPIRRFLFNATCGDEELSKDMAQETFLKAWLNIGSYRATSKFSTWLYKIAWHTCCDHFRARKNTRPLDALANRIADEHENTDFPIDFMNSLAILGERERVVVLLYYMEDATIAQIAKIIGCPSGTVKSHLSRSKAKLKQFFESNKHDYGEE